MMFGVGFRIYRCCDTQTLGLFRMVRLARRVMDLGLFGLAKGSESLGFRGLGFGVKGLGLRVYGLGAAELRSTLQLAASSHILLAASRMSRFCVLIGIIPLSVSGKIVAKHLLIRSDKYDDVVIDAYSQMTSFYLCLFIFANRQVTNQRKIHTTTAARTRIIAKGLTCYIHVHSSGFRDFRVQALGFSFSDFTGFGTCSEVTLPLTLTRNRATTL